jgi:ABC-2 type transport system ATP-binding protein
MLEIRGLVKSYGKREVLKGLDLTVREGSLYGLIGCNGAGKSTLFKSVLGFVFPQAGSLLFRGIPTHTLAFRRTVGYLPELVAFPPDLTAEEFLAYAWSFHGPWNAEARQRIARCLEDVGLHEDARRRIRTFSKGMKQRLGIAQAIIHDPTLLILDEPFTGLDPIGTRELRAILERQYASGKTILFSSHDLTEVQNLCSVVGVLHQGRMAWEGPLSELLKRFQTQDLEEAFIRLHA